MTQQFRKGDRVSIECLIDADHHDDEVRVKIDGIWGSGGSYYAKVDGLKMVNADIRVGDTVEWTVGEKTFTGEVLAIADDHAWVHLCGGDYATVWLKNATRTDPEPVKAEEAA